MLVLTRKQNEKIQIGDNITITILRTKGKAVRIGIEAPGSVSVLRGELAEKQIDQQQEQSSAAAKSLASPAKKIRDKQAQPADAWASTKPEKHITHKRTSRSRVATVLPKLLGAESMADSMNGAGPLRSMLDRRATQARVS